MLVVAAEEARVHLEGAAAAQLGRVQGGEGVGGGRRPANRVDSFNLSTTAPNNCPTNIASMNLVMACPDAKADVKKNKKNLTVEHSNNFDPIINYH